MISKTKNLLFIGDLRSAKNYGAIATSETLINMLNDQNFDLNIRYIDFRSLHSPTPINGFPPVSLTNDRKTFFDSIKKTIPKPIKQYSKNLLKLLLGKQNKKSTIDFVPYKLSQYEDYYQNMLNGKILQYEKQMLGWADVVYINGEGNIVNGTDAFGKYRMGARYILFMAWVSKVKYNKPTLIVNHTVDPNNYNAFEIISNTYPLLDVVFVRETLSLPVLESINVHNTSFVPDALFAYKPSETWIPSDTLKKQIDFSTPYICIGDSSGLRNQYNKAKWDVVSVFGKIIRELKEITPQIIFIDGYNGGNTDLLKVVKENNLGYVALQNCSYHELYHVLKGAELFISGRWHASILSTLAETPILLWGSDSHKTRSLYTLLDYNYRFYEVSTLPVNIDDMIDTAKSILGDSTVIKQNMREKNTIYAQKALDNVKILNKYIN